MKRPNLRKIDPPPIGGGPEIMITCSVGQWDALLDEFYNQGAVILELDGEEKLINAYQKEKRSP